MLDLLCMQLASYLERGPLMWMMPLDLHVNQKSDYDDDETDSTVQKLFIEMDTNIIRISVHLLLIV